MNTRFLGFGLAAALFCLGPIPAQDDQSSYARWSHGPSTAADYFPIAVWLQSPRRAKQYAAAGINLYVGLWKGPTEEQLAALEAAGMRVVCDQNEVGLRHLDSATIIGWMHGDESDNAQSLGEGKGYGPPIAPREIVEQYQQMQLRDPSRPVLLNLGQGVAWDGWIGRGVRTGHPEDYPEYLRGADIASFDIYPVAHSRPQVQGKLWFVADGVRRLRGFAGEDRIVWNCIECTHISSTRKATPAQVRAEVWMSLIHGSRGLIYFVHEFKPKFQEAALLGDPEMLAAVGTINHQIHALAAVINSSEIAGAATVVSADESVPIAWTTRRLDGATYVFAVAMREGTTEARFTVADVPASAIARVLGEDREVEVRGGRFRDRFAAWDVHLYRIAGAGK